MSAWPPKPPNASQTQYIAPGDIKALEAVVRLVGEAMGAIVYVL